MGLGTSAGSRVVIQLHETPGITSGSTRIRPGRRRIGIIAISAFLVNRPVAVVIPVVATAISRPGTRLQSARSLPLSSNASLAADLADTDAFSLVRSRVTRPCITRLAGLPGR